MVFIAHTQEFRQTNTKDGIYTQSNAHFDEVPPYLVTSRSQSQKITLEYMGPMFSSYYHKGRKLWQIKRLARKLRRKHLKFFVANLLAKRQSLLLHQLCLKHRKNVSSHNIILYPFFEVDFKFLANNLFREGVNEFDVMAYFN